MSQKTAKVCNNGHTFFKSSDCPVCPVCPVCEAQKKSEIFAGLSAPAKRAMENNGITSLAALAAYSKKEVLRFHGVGKTAIPILEKLLNEQGLAFRE